MKRNRNRYRLVDIAREANVSINTVSKVLLGRAKEAGISEKTSDRVNKIADKLGYIPDQTARNLRAQHTDIVGIYIDDVTDPVRADCLHTILQELSNQKHFPLITVAEAGYDKCCEAYLRNKIRGLILCGTMREMDADFFSELQRQKITTVVVGSFFFPLRQIPSFAEISIVNVDNYLGIKLVVDHLREQGFTRIAYISGPERDSDTHERLAAYTEIVGEYHAPIIARIQKELSYLEIGYLGAQQLTKNSKEFDAIAAYDDKTALGAIKWLHEQKITVPTQVAIAGFDNIPETIFFTPSLTSINQPTEQIGIKSVELLLNHITKENDPEKVLLPPTLVPRESTQKNRC